MMVMEERKDATFRAALFADPAMTDEQALWWEQLAEREGTGVALRMLSEARALQHDAYLE
jgi:hypothetical protein